MSDLNAGFALRPRMNEIDYSFETRFVLVVVQCQAVRCDATFRADVHDFREHDRRTGKRKMAKIHDMLIVGRSIDGRVLTHRGNNHAVIQLQLAKLNRREQLTHRSLRTSPWGSPVAAATSRSPVA